MANTIDVAFVQQYSANVQILEQQLGSKLSTAVRVEPQVGEYSYYDQVARVPTLTSDPAQHADTAILNTPHSRRRVGLTFYAWAELIDDEDQVKMLVDPANVYAQNAAYKFGVQKDDIILAAADAGAATGKTGGTTTQFDANMVIPASGTGTNSDWIGTSGVLNLKKIQGAAYLLDLQDVPESDRYFIAHPKGKADLLNDEKLTSADYNTVKTLVQGDIDSFMGFKFIFTTRVTFDAQPVYYNYAWHKSAMLLAMGQDDLGPKARIEERPDKNYSTQVFNSMSVGATRMSETAIVKIQTL